MKVLKIWICGMAVFVAMVSAQASDITTASPSNSQLGDFNLGLLIGQNIGESSNETHLSLSYGLRFGYSLSPEFEIGLNITKTYYEGRLTDSNGNTEITSFRNYLTLADFLYHFTSGTFKGAYVGARGGLAFLTEEASNFVDGHLNTQHVSFGPVIGHDYSIAEKLTFGPNFSYTLISGLGGSTMIHNTQLQGLLKYRF